MTQSSNAGRTLPWLTTGPAILWTLAFFIVPFMAMVVVSLDSPGGDGLSLANYQQFFSNPSYYRALVNSLEVTVIVTVVSILMAYPFAWILAEQINALEAELRPLVRAGWRQAP